MTRSPHLHKDNVRWRHVNMSTKMAEPSMPLKGSSQIRPLNGVSMINKTFCYWLKKKVYLLLLDLLILLAVSNSRSRDFLLAAILPCCVRRYVLCWQNNQWITLRIEIPSSQRNVLAGFSVTFTKKDWIVPASRDTHCRVNTSFVVWELTSVMAIKK